MANTLLTVGLFSTLVLMAVNAVRFKKSGKEIFKGLLIRCSVGFFVGSLAYMIPNDVLLQHYFGDNPSYMEAYKNWEANPNDPGAIEKLEEEQLKLNVHSDLNDSLR